MTALSRLIAIFISKGRVSGCTLGKPLEVLSFQRGRIGVGLAGCAELSLDDVVARTIKIAQSL
jgi:hypothetical protein